MVKVVWTDSAINDLNDIGEWISKESQKYAEITVTRLFDAPEIIEHNPQAGPMVPDFNDESIRQLIRNNYRIVYKIMDDHRVDILTIHRCERLIQNTFDLNTPE
jgi:toxin ParE1/3/4